MPRHHAAVHIAIALLAALAACTPPTVVAPPAGPGPGPGPTAPKPTAAGHPGFDTGLYPGDAALRAWQAASPYEWVGYYLPAPCHRDLSWSGKRAALIEMGWSTAVIYVGQQDWAQMPSRQAPQTPAVDSAAAARNPPPAQQPQPPAPSAAPACSAANLVAGRGNTDADDAAAKAAAEGFPAGSVVYLDVERVQSVSVELVNYVREWTIRVLAGGRYLPGLYCHRLNAGPLVDAMRAGYLAAGRSDAPPVWVTATDPAFTLDQPPRGSGVDAATVWQGRLDVSESWGGVTLRVDQNVSATRSPSSPPP